MTRAEEAIEGLWQEFYEVREMIPDNPIEASYRRKDLTTILQGISYAENIKRMEDKG